MKQLKKALGTVLSAALLLALAVLGITYRSEIWAVLTRQDARDAFIAYVRNGGFTGRGRNRESVPNKKTQFAKARKNPHLPGQFLPGQMRIFWFLRKYSLRKS